MKPLRFLPASFLLGAASLHAADAIALRQQWLPGKQYHQTVTTKTLSTFNIGGQEMAQKMDNTIEITTTVKAHEDGARKRINLRYNRMAVKMDMMGQSQSFDSAKPEEDPAGIGKSATAIVGKEIRMVTTPTGEVESVENLDDVIGKPADNPNAAMMGQMLTKENLKEIISQNSLKTLPSTPISPGATWDFTNQVTLPQVGSVSLKGTYTYKGMTDVGGIPCAEITFEATMTPDAGDKPAANPMGLKLGSAKMTGTTHFDNAIGIARDSSVEQKMEMEIANPSQPGETLRIPMTQNVTTTLTSVEDAP